MDVEDWVMALAASPWVFVALYLFVTIDGFFPPVPSESAVIALGALATSTGHPNFWVLGAVAAAGAFTGDQIAYSIGRRLPVRRLRIMQGRRGRRAADWAENALAERGAALILAARYIPIGRVAVNMTAGSVGFPRARVTGLAAIAAVTWSAYSVALGMSAGVWLHDHPVVAVVVGVAGGLLLGLAIDPLLKRLLGGRGRPRSVEAVVATPRSPGDAADAGTPRSPRAAADADTPRPGTLVAPVGPMVSTITAAVGEPEA